MKHSMVPLADGMRWSGLPKGATMPMSEKGLYDLLRGLSIDMHMASTRPCETCRELTAKLGWPFGCYQRQEEHQRLVERLGAKRE